MKYFRLQKNNEDEPSIQHSESEWMKYYEDEQKFNTAVSNGTLIRIERPIKNFISIEDYFKPDIRICEVVSAERIKTSKFLLLMINTGLDTRPVVTNIGYAFEPVNFIGKKLPFVLNLAPTVINKHESKAMIVMAEPFNTPMEFLDYDLPVGTIII